MTASGARGYSLLELLIVLIIASLLLVLVPPLFSGTLATAKVKKTATELAASLKYLRSRAITGQEERLLILDLANRRYSLGLGQPYRRLPEGLHVQLWTARSEQLSRDLAAVRFYPDGSSTGGRITLRGQTLQAVIDVNWLTGQVKVYDESPSAR